LAYEYDYSCHRSKWRHGIERLPGPGWQWIVQGPDIRQPKGQFPFRFIAADIPDSTQLEAAFQTIKEKAGSLKQQFQFRYSHSPAFDIYTADEHNRLDLKMNQNS
jgi:hypothetical protein